jgi:NO-binding membrane sensor protein with MHYT domain
VPSLFPVLLMDQRRLAKSLREQRMWMALAAVALGGGGIFCMHQVGMTALTITDHQGQELKIG